VRWNFYKHTVVEISFEADKLYEQPTDRRTHFIGPISRDKGHPSRLLIGINDYTKIDRLGELFR